MSGEEYVEAVLSLVERIPPGRVMSYGAIADALAPASGRSSPRRVGTVMARYGGPVPWHRVVAADGRLVPGHEERARRRLVAEGTPMRGDKVDMGAAAWYPGDLDRPGAAGGLTPDPGRRDGPARSRTR
jgi:alkylated DNA nucleotide flippase Atl1